LKLAATRRYEGRCNIRIVFEIYGNAPEKRGWSEVVSDVGLTAAITAAVAAIGQ
jgi:hypothetical protein